MGRINLSVVFYVLWSGLAAGQELTNGAPFSSEEMAATDQTLGYARIAKPYASHPPQSVFIERTSNQSEFSMVQSGPFVAPAVPLADPNSSFGSSYATASGDPSSYPIDISEVDMFGVMPYFGYIDYGTKSVKSIGETTGLYAYATTTINTVELGFDDTRINFRSGFHFNQQDITPILTDYSIPNVRLRAGVHYMINNDPTTNGGTIGFLGAHYFVKDSWEAGVDVYASRYAAYSPPVTIFQIAPRLTWNLNSAFRVESTGYYIHPDQEIGLNQQNFYSLEGRMVHNFGSFEVAAFGWGGQQTFAVRNNGFVVYNLNEKHTGGYGADVMWRFGKQTQFTTRVNNEKFSDFATQQGTNQMVITMMLLYTF